jgi:hypothetical protein
MRVMECRYFKSEKVIRYGKSNQNKQRTIPTDTLCYIIIHNIFNTKEYLWNFLLQVERGLLEIP